MRNLHVDATKRIIDQLKTGVAPWSRDWSRSAGANVVANAVSKRPYSGANVVFLWIAMQSNGYTVPRFLTFKQAKELGGTVRAGEHGHKVYFVKRLTKTDESPEGDSETRSFTMLREYTVFNVAQCDGLPARVMTIEPAAVWNHDARSEVIDAFVTDTKAQVTEGAGEAYYRPSTDQIVMPGFPAFKSADAFYSTLFHELTHWTGAKKRLARDFSGRFGTQAYAAEELVAELGSAFLCAEFGIDNTGRHAAYIANWITLLEKDGKAFFTAASAAQKAVEHLRGLVLADESQQEAA